MKEESLVVELVEEEEKVKGCIKFAEGQLNSQQKMKIYQEKITTNLINKEERERKSDNKTELVPLEQEEEQEVAEMPQLEVAVALRVGGQEEEEVEEEEEEEE